MIAVRTRFHPLVDTDEAHTGRCGRQSRAMLTVAEVDMRASFGSRLSMALDNDERSNRGGAGGKIGDFLSIDNELGGKEAEIGESPRTRAESRP
jgi:hypothetical protein